MLPQLKKLFGKTRSQLAVGTDLVYIPDVDRSVSLFGRRYLNFIFTEAEMADCGQDSADHCRQRLAARLAAKEAVMKILRPKRDEYLPWRSIEICKDAAGAPNVCLHHPATSLAKRAGLNHFTLTMSHEHQYATAVVVGTSGF